MRLSSVSTGLVRSIVAAYVQSLQLFKETWIKVENERQQCCRDHRIGLQEARSHEIRR